MFARVLALFVAVALAGSQAPVIPAARLEALPYAPRQYVCYRAPAPLTVDGRLVERAWTAIPWSDAFVDIEGGTRPLPRFRTRARMLWDDGFLYVAVELEEPDLWATLTDRDSVIFNDNDIEVFIDADGDTHTYAEFEVNARGTVWDLMLVRPYRDGGPAINAWDATGLKSAVSLRGTLNRPGDRDDGWTLEMAIPWRVLRETAPGKRPPRPGDHWRVNFSRVEWRLDASGGRYQKRVDPGIGRPVAADNWVWSPQGVVDMHMPERWGLVQFSGLDAGAGTEAFVEDANDRVKWALRRLYYRQREFRAAHGRYAAAVGDLEGPPVTVEGLDFKPRLQATSDTYQLDAPGFGGWLAHLQHDGRVWLQRGQRGRE